MKCLIDSKGRVCEVRLPEHVFPVHPSLSWIDCPDDVQTEDTFDGVQFHARKTAEAQPEPTAEAVTLRAIVRKFRRVGQEVSPSDLAEALAELKAGP